jgi:hypothetical protein
MITIVAIITFFKFSRREKLFSENSLNETNYATNNDNLHLTADDK